MKIDGLKTYAVAAAMVVYAISAAFLGKIDANAAIEIILAAAAVAGLRHGVNKV